MNAKETKIQPFIEGSKQFVVPLFQRPYSWELKHWETLWDDLMELYVEDQPRTHFMGSVVTMPAVSVPEGVTKYVLIDGQQRLTTILILLALVRDQARSLPGTLADQIENLLLLNPYQEGNDRLKLLPTQVDRQNFMGVVRGEVIEQEDQIARAYKFFEKQVRTTDGLNLDKLRGIIVGRLLIVSIVLDADDNPHLIFESLNAKGRALTQADLIRNYFFMRVHVEQQEKLYNMHWAPLQLRLGDNLTECIRHFLMKDGSVVKQGEVFFTLKDRADRKSQKEVIQYLEELARYAGYYERLLHPERETNPKIRRLMESLNRLEVTTAYPFLLNVYNEYSQGSMSEADFVEILSVLENFIIRRFICGVPTNTLNKMFPLLYSQAKQASGVVEGAKAILATKNYPRDAEFREKLTTARLYGGDRGVKGRLMLERLEESFGHLEPVELGTLTVEHVLPQTLSDWWREHLGKDWEELHQVWLDTIGNLTLSGYNPHLSNSDFFVKRSILKSSHLELNKQFEDFEVWNETSIHSRASRLATRALQVWRDFRPAGAGADEPIADDADQNDQTAGLDWSLVSATLGGITRLPSDHKIPLFSLSDGKVVTIKYSKLHTDRNHFWYGLRPGTLDELRAAGSSHIVFVMGQAGMAVIPIETIDAYCSQTRATFNQDGTIRHYHILISNEPTPQLYWSQDTPRYSLDDCFVPFK